MLLVTLVEHLVCFMFRLHKFNRGRSVLTSLHSSKTILLLRKYLALMSYFFYFFILVQIQKLSEGSFCSYPCETNLKYSFFVSV